VLSAVMLMKQAMGIMPELNPIAMISQMIGTQQQALGWVVHFLIGAALWGVAFVWLNPVLPGPHWFRGALFGTGAWVIMMIVVMPITGAGLFGMKLGVMAPVATLAMHWIYGVVLGGVYGAMSGAGSTSNALKADRRR